MKTCSYCGRSFSDRPWGRHCSTACSFWSKVRLFEEHPKGCWEWAGSRQPNGYGTFRVRETKTWDYAHRVSWMMVNGPIPDGMDVCHQCDNNPCVRPDHLFLGTRQENMLDSSGKGRTGPQKHPERYPRGERIGWSKLTETDVLEIRRLHRSGLVSQGELARKFSVSGNSIQRIVHRKSWKHVP